MMGDWKHLTTYTNFLEKVSEQHTHAIDAIGGDKSAHDEIFTPTYREGVRENYENLQQSFSEDQRPLLNILAEDMYDTVLVHERLIATYLTDRNFYYAKASEEYQKYKAKFEFQRALYEKYVAAHRDLL